MKMFQWLRVGHRTPLHLCTYKRGSRTKHLVFFDNNATPLRGVATSDKEVAAGQYNRRQSYANNC
jgi:hypothetical protein